MRALWIAAAATFATDQISKIWVVQALNLRTLGRIEVLPGVLEFRMAWNRGVNFGLGASGSDLARWALIAMALAISAWLIWWVRRESHGAWTQAFVGLLAGGAIGNALDRLLYGAVADFLNVSCCGIANPWSFNLADIGVFVGAIGLALFTGAGSAKKTP
ncbi:MAG: signal peptidase II [Rhodobacterales bacterium]|nr:MAG: signal peptidase II [Rhodobacterales bacterium]